MKFIEITSAFAIGFAFCASCLQADYKTEIQQCQLQLQSAAKENKASLALQLAELYSKDQDLEMAFRTYLQALEWTVPVPEPVPTPDELKHYAEGLTIYLDHSGATPGAIALKLQEQLNPVLKEHPDYYLVNFLMAAAFANVGLFQEFFHTFYQSYQRYPTHYMAYKTQAVLHIKLYERVRTAAEREEQREAVMAFVRKAMDKNAKDSGLYKLMMLFASEKEKPVVVKDCLNKILEDPMIIARGDIAFLVQQAASVQEWERAQQLIDKAKELFKYSRIVIAAQEYLDKQKTASK